MKQIEEPARRIPVRAEVDVLVVGAGLRDLWQPRRLLWRKAPK